MNRDFPATTPSHDQVEFHYLSHTSSIFLGAVKITSNFLTKGSSGPGALCKFGY